MNGKEITKGLLKNEYAAGYVTSIQTTGSCPDVSKTMLIRLTDISEKFEHNILADGCSGKVIIAILD